MKKSILFLFLAIFLILSSCSSDSRDEAEPIWYYLTRTEFIDKGITYGADHKGKCRGNTRLALVSDDSIKYINSSEEYNNQTGQYRCTEYSTFYKYNSTDKTIDRSDITAEHYAISGNKLLIYSKNHKSYYEAK